MNVAWILYGSLEQRTGGTLYDAIVVDGLRRLGDHVDVISLTRGGRAAVAGQRIGDVVRTLARLRPDVIVGDELCFRELAFLFPRCPFARRVLLVHHLSCWEEEIHPLARERARLFESITLRHADRVITTSETTRTRLLREGVTNHRNAHPHKTRIRAVLPGADRLPRVTPQSSSPSTSSPSTFSPSSTTSTSTSSSPSSWRCFLFVGSIIPRKRVHMLIDALPMDATLRLVGSCDRDPAYVRSLPKNDRVTYLSEVTEAALAAEFANADALVMPSSLEGYGMAATEAIHAGLPVIAARAPGLLEALAAPFATGAVAFFNDATDLSRILHAADLTAMRSAAKQASQQMPTWQATVRLFRQSIRE